MLQCGVCGCTDFYKASGYSFCSTCQTQNQDAGEELELELPIENNTRLRKTRIRRAKSDKIDEEVGWTSWELYNFVLIGLTNELIELGIPADIKITVLQLWARYLGKLEIAFISTNKKLVPKLARRYKKRDAEIIYGKVLSQKRVKKRRKADSNVTDSAISTYLSEETSLKELNRNKKLMITADYDRFMQSQMSSEGDTLSTFNQSVYSMQSSAHTQHTRQSSENERIQFNSSAKEETRRIKNMAKKIPVHKRRKYRQNHVTTQYKTGPELITPMKLWAILYLALRIHDQNIHLGDMLRYGREGHLSYYRLDRLIPPEVTLTKSDINFLSRAADITHKGMRRIIGRMAKFLGVTKIICPDFLPLINRYCSELNLPRGISLYTERLVALSPPKMKFDKRSCIPNYEGRAMAFIIVILKTLLNLDDITEYEISNVADKINSIGNFDDGLIIEKMTSCKKAASTGYQSLLNGASSIEAVETALCWLECDEFFNCGYGSVLNNIGNVQMDACIIDGFKLECGSVAAVSDIEHPISLARYVLHNFPNSIIVGEGARKLAGDAKLNLLSKGNMIAPTAYLAHKLKETDSCDVNLDIEDHCYAKPLENCGSTIGCIAYDGCTIAAGVTSGGSNRKLVGSVGDSSILGCSVYANRNVGCSLTSHGESITKFGLSRVIASDIERGYSPWKALKRNLACVRDYTTKYNCIVGGIVFKKSSEWSVYFTSHKMSYVVIMNDCMTFGTTLDDKKIEKYTEYRKRLPCDCRFPLVNNFTLDVINDEGICDTKLFSFREWQKYIECRRAVLANAHYPTKLKYNLRIPDVNNLYIKFLEALDSKIDREEPEITTHKHLIPRELVHAMKQCIANISYTNLPINEVYEFSPSLTAQHSYLQQLLEHPLYDLPSILRNDFFSAKIGYMTKPEFICKLTSHYNMQLNFIDSNLHFIEKTVSLFEQTKMASTKDLKDNTAIQDFLEEDIERKENFIDYLHKKIACHLKIDVKKRQYYDNSRNAVIKDIPSSNEFIFNEALPNGKLSIPDTDDNENEDDDENDTCLKGIVPEETALLLSKFCKEYDISLSSTEKKAIFKDLSQKKKQKPKLFRNAQGKFVKQNDIENPNKNDSYTEESEIISRENFEIKNILPNISDILNLSTNASIFDDLIKNEIGYDAYNQSENSCKEPVIDDTVFDTVFTLDENLNDNTLRLFRPFKDYWMYHCNFSRVKPKNFELFEKMLPRSFRWLLNECASVIEMSVEDLYEEVCLIEAYYAYFSEPSKSAENSNNKAYINAILRKW